jgi:hypothetical protein
MATAAAARPVDRSRWWSRWPTVTAPSTPTRLPSRTPTPPPSGSWAVGREHWVSDAGGGRHGQDWPPGGAAAAGARPTNPDRLALREPPFDWDDQATWAPALRNIQSVCLTYHLDLAYTPSPAGSALCQWCRLGAELAGLVGR